MTLIAAFRCEIGGRPAVAICADSQETVGSVRVAVTKVAPQDLGAYEVAIAGSGNGDLIDGFTDRLVSEIRSWPQDLEEATARGLVRGLALDFHRNEIECYPATSPDDKLSHMLVCIKPKESPDIFLWELRGPVIVSVDDYALIGIGEAIYGHELKRLYTPGLSPSQAGVLGIHLISLAKATSNYVGGETRVVYIGEHTKSAVQEYVSESEQAFAEFNKMLAKLFLSLDPAVSFRELEKACTDFQQEAYRLKKAYTERIFKIIMGGGLRKKLAAHGVTLFRVKMAYSDAVGEASESVEPGDEWSDKSVIEITFDDDEPDS